MRQSLLLVGLLLWQEARAKAGAHLLHFSLCPLPLVLTLGTTREESGPVAFTSSIKYGDTALRFLWVFFLQAKQCQVSHLFLVCQVLQSVSPALCWTLCNMFWGARHWTQDSRSVSPVLSRSEWPHLLQPAGSPLPSTARDAAGLLSHGSTLLARVQLIH